MKNFLKMGLAVTVVLSTGLAAGCSSESGTAATSGANTEAAKLGKIVYIPGLTGNPFYSTVSCGAGTEAKKQGVEFTTQGASTFDVAKQTEIVNAVVAGNPGAIMISVTDPKAMIVPLAQAKAAGIKIIGIDGDLEDTGVMTTNIQSDGVQGGMLAGEALAKLVGGKGSVMAIDNATGSLVSKARTDGFQQAIAKYPDMKFLGIQYSKNETAKAASIASTTATTNPDLVGIFTAETNNTEGAITGLREAGKTGKVRLVGYDTSEPIVKALRDKVLDGTVVQYPYGEGVLGVQSAVAAMRGEPVERNQRADAVFATPENVDTPKVKQYIYDVNCSAS
ncbi:ABC transporter substrate-binding protein [Streptosporangium oxazolinicum]|uniref:ABC transporter substrate-binding protein n=1 Tax=Streptosporangium oxazolinicum TaxID=909287 RepID=A0ABP8AII9_9ACTN